MNVNPYIIEELYTQDHQGIVFVATDVLHSKIVWIHRFFPHDDAEQGMDQVEMLQFQTSVNFMRFWSHRSLRKIYDGGVDSIDFMPYVVCEPSSESTLESFVSTSTLSIEQGRQLAQQALDLVIEMEKVLGGGAGWIMLDPKNIEVNEDGTKFRFGIHPVKWVDQKQNSTSLKELISLIEMVMGWTGRVVAGSASGSLSGWVRQVRSKNLTAQEARSLLQGIQPSSTTDPAVVNPPVSENKAKTESQNVSRNPPVTAPLQPKVQLASLQKKSPLPWVIAGSLAVTAIGILIYLISQSPPQQQISEEKAIVTPPPTNEKNLTNQSAAEPLPQNTPQSTADNVIVAPTNLNDATTKNTNAVTPAKKAQANLPKAPLLQGEYSPDQEALIGKQVGNTISVVGLVSIVKDNQSPYRYIKFDTPSITAVCGRYPIEKRAYLMALDSLKRDLEGKRVRLTGIVHKEPISNGFRFVIEIHGRKNQIEIIENP